MDGIIERERLTVGPRETERVLRLLRAREAELRGRGVTRLRLFGSVARGEAGPASDVDLIAEIDPAARFSLVELVGLQQELGDAIGREVQIATAPQTMRPWVRERVEVDAVQVF